MDLRSLLLHGHNCENDMQNGSQTAKIWWSEYKVLSCHFSIRRALDAPTFPQHRCRASFAPLENPEPPIASLRKAVVVIFHKSW